MEGPVRQRPLHRKGFEAAVAYASPTSSDTRTIRYWQATPFGKSFAPGRKDFDFYLAQVTTSRRATSGSTSALVLPGEPGLVVKKDREYAHVTSLSDLKDATLGRGVDHQLPGDPGRDPAQQRRQGLQLDLRRDAGARERADRRARRRLPDRLLHRVRRARRPRHRGTVRRFGSEDQWGLVMEKGSPLKSCVDRAVSELKSSGELQALEQKWLSDLADAPTLQ